MRKLISWLMSLMLATSLVPSAAFADEPTAKAGAPSTAPTLALEFDRYDPLDSSGPVYVFAVRSSEAPTDAISIAYGTFQGTTAGDWFVPVRSSVTLEAGQQAVEIKITAREPDDASLDSYVHPSATGAEPDKYFGVTLLASSAGSIDTDRRTAVTSPGLLSGKAKTVDAAGSLSPEGEGEFLEVRFEIDDGTTQRLTGMLPLGLYSHDDDAGTYAWRLAAAPTERTMSVDVRRLHDDQLISGSERRLDPYFFAAGGQRFVFAIDYDLHSTDRYHEYTADDVGTDLAITDAVAGTVLKGPSSLEAWRTVAAVATSGTSWQEGPLSVAAPRSIPLADTVAGYAASRGVEDADSLDWANERVHGYESAGLEQGATTTLQGVPYFVTDTPPALTARFTFTPNNPAKLYELDMGSHSAPLKQDDVAYGYEVKAPTLSYALLDQRPPDAGGRDAVFSQSQYAVGERIRVSVVFDELVTAAPDAPAALQVGAGGPTVALSLEGGLGTNVLEYAGVYQGEGATTEPEALACSLSLPAGIVDMVGNATSEATSVSCEASFSDSKNIAIPQAPVLAAADASGNPVENGGVATSQVTLTFAQPENDPARDAVVAYDVTEDNGVTYTRVERPTVNGAYGPATYVVESKGMHDVAARAIAVGGIAGPLSAPLSFARYDQDETPGEFSLSVNEDDYTFTVTREGGSLGAQTVTMRTFRGTTTSDKTLSLESSGRVIEFAAGEAGSKTYEYSRDSASTYQALEDSPRKAGIEIASVEGRDGAPSAGIKRGAGSALVAVRTDDYTTKGIYAANPDGSPAVAPGERLEANEMPSDTLYLAPGETESANTSTSFGSSGSSKVDAYFRVRFNMIRDAWSFTGMYDVDVRLAHGEETLFHGWEDYDNVGNNGRVELPGGPGVFNNYDALPSDKISRMTYYTHQGSETTADLYHLADVSNGSAFATLTVGTDGRLADKCTLEAGPIYTEGFIVDKEAPRLKSISLADDTFYPGNEVRAYVKFNECVTATDMTVKLYDENHATCYATLSASGPRELGGDRASLEGLGGSTFMMSGYLDGGATALPERVIIEVEAANTQDFVGNVSTVTASDTVGVDSSEIPPPPTPPDEPSEASGSTYGFFHIAPANAANSFTITRDGGVQGRQQVFFRTRYGTNDPANPFFAPVESNAVMFEEGQQTATVYIQPRAANADSAGYYSDNGAERRFGVEIYDVIGGGELGDSTSAYRAVSYEGYEVPWSLDLASYLYLPDENTRFKRASFTANSSYSFTTDFFDDANRYFSAINGAHARMYSQLHAYQNKTTFLLTAQDVTTTVISGSGTTLYQGHEDFDNTNKDSCYFPESVPINSGNEADDSPYTASISGTNVDNRSIGRVYDLTREETVMTYDLSGFNEDLEVKDAWLDYLFYDHAEPVVQDLYLSAAALVAGQSFSVSAVFDEIVYGEDARLEVYAADGTTLLGTMASPAGSGTSVLEFAGSVPVSYQGGAFIVRISGTVRDKTGNIVNPNTSTCWKRFDADAFTMQPPRVTVSTDGARSFTTSGGTTYYNQATVLIDQVESGAETLVSFDGVTYAPAASDRIALSGESSAYSIWVKAIKNGVESTSVLSDPVAIDTIGPSLNPTIDPSWVTSPAIIETHVRDGGVGAARIDVVPSGSATVLGDLLTVRVRENGRYELQAVDELGNVGAQSVVDVTTIDTAPPPVPVIYSGGEPVSFTKLSQAGSPVYYVELSTSDSIAFSADDAHEVQSPESYAYSYEYWNPTLSVQLYETDATAWREGELIPVSYSRPNPASFLPDTNEMTSELEGELYYGHNLYVYGNDEAHENPTLFIFNTTQVEPSTNVYVTPYETDGAGPVAPYGGGWTKNPVAFELDPEIVEGNATTHISALEYSTDGTTWESVQNSSAGSWQPAGDSLDDGGTFIVSDDQQRTYRFRALALDTSAGTLSLCNAGGSAIMTLATGGAEGVANALEGPVSFDPHPSKPYDVSIDTVQPVSTVKLECDGDDVTAGTSEYLVKPVVMSLDIDNSASVPSGASLEVRMRDGGDSSFGEWIAVPAGEDGDAAHVTRTVTKQGTTDYEVRAVSGSGVTSEVQPCSTKIDTMAPQMTSYEYEPGQNGEGSIVFTASDALADDRIDVSGVDMLRYRIELDTGSSRTGGLLFDGSDSVTLDVGTSDRAVVSYQLIDKAGNESEERVIPAHRIAIGAVTAEPATSSHAWTSERSFTLKVDPIIVPAGSEVAEVTCGTSPYEVETYRCTLAPDKRSATCDVTVDGHTLFYVRARDTEGNVSSTESIAIYCDITPPSLDVSVTADDGGPWNAPNQAPTFTYSTADEDSGVVQMTCTINGKAQTVDESGSFTVAEEGTVSVELEATDKVGLSSRASYTLDIDRTAPRVAGVSYAAKASGFSGTPATLMTVSTADDAPTAGAAGFGTAFVRYRLVDVQGQEGVERKLAVSGESATLEIDADFEGAVRLQPVDAAGNSGEAVSYPVHAVDVSAAASDPATSSNAWTSKDVELSVQLKVNGTAPLDTVFWSTTPGQAAGAPLTVSADGSRASATVRPDQKTTYYINAYDENGAFGVERAITVYADRIVPSLTAEPRERGTSSVWFPSVTFDFSASDADSGLARVTYTEAGQVKRAHGSSFTVTAEGSYPVAVVAVDRAGNTTRKVYEVHVVEAAVAEVVNAIGALPGPRSPQDVIAAHRDDIMRTTYAFMSLSPEQKAKVPLESLEALEDLYARIVPLVIKRTDADTGIRLVGLAFALDIPELDTPGAIVELSVKTRNVAQGGMTREELEELAKSKSYELYEVWDVVIEKRVIIGATETVEIVAAGQWRDGALVLARFPLPEGADANDATLISLSPDGIENVRSRVKGSSVYGELSHLSYYGVATYHEPLAPVVPDPAPPGPGPTPPGPGPTPPPEPEPTPPEPGPATPVIPGNEDPTSLAPLPLPTGSESGSTANEMRAKPFLPTGDPLSSVIVMAAVLVGGGGAALALTLRRRRARR